MTYGIFCSGKLTWKNNSPKINQKTVDKLKGFVVYFRMHYYGKLGIIGSKNVCHEAFIF